MKRGVGLLAILLLALPALAQEPFPERPRVTLSGAYSYVRTSLADQAGDNEAALSASATVRFGENWAGRFDAIQVLGDFPADGIAPTEARIFVGGPEYRRIASTVGVPSSQSFDADRVELFAHALVGGSRVNGQGEFAAAVGGGADYLWTDLVSIRLFQVQYVFADVTGAGKQNFRLTTGVSFNF
jgi:hypothetical protein